MLLVAGLGNPGPDYARNRHNVGFMAVDEIVRRHGLGPFRSKFDGEIAQGEVAGQRVAVLKPMTFMNNSGQSVGAAMRFYKIVPDAVVVYHDELDLAAAKVRLKKGGGHAGHNGLRSIQAHIGPDFRRVRIGIGHPGDKARVLGHVLDDFSKADDAWLERLLPALADHFPLVVAGDDLAYMSKVAQAVGPVPTPTAPKPETNNG
jgi:PTH1 family peptidyl-tRNA hydrolase